jgi:hypothetical protein
MATCTPSIHVFLGCRLIMYISGYIVKENKTVSYKSPADVHHVILRTVSTANDRVRGIIFMVSVPSKALRSDQFLCAACLIDHCAACSRTCFENGPLQ